MYTLCNMASPDVEACFADDYVPPWIWLPETLELSWMVLPALQLFSSDIVRHVSRADRIRRNREARDNYGPLLRRKRRWEMMPPPVFSGSGKNLTEPIIVPVYPRNAYYA